MTSNQITQTGTAVPTTGVPDDASVPLTVGTDTSTTPGPAVPADGPVDRPNIPILRTARRERGTGPDGNVPVPAGTVGHRISSAIDSIKEHGDRARGLLTVVVAIVASLGQSEYARAHGFVHLIEIPKITLMHGYYLPSLDVTPWLAVAVFDLSVVALLYGGRKAYLVWELSPWPFWITAAAAAAFSTFTNTQHVGGWVTAPASAVLFFMWFLALFYEYLAWRREKGHRAGAAPNLLGSRLLVIDRRLAVRAWIIASTRPLARGVAYRTSLGEKDLTVRDLAILTARLYLDVFDDQLADLLRLADDKPPKIGRRRRRLHERKATMTAWDAVDRYMGLPVIERSGIIPARVTYAAVEEPPAPPVRTVPRQPRVPAQQPTAEQADQVSPISVPPAPAARKPARADAVPDVPASLLRDYGQKIEAVQKAVGDAWWNGPKALTVNQVQAHIRNRDDAAVVRRCLAFLRAQQLGLESDLNALDTVAQPA